MSNSNLMNLHADLIGAGDETSSTMSEKLYEVLREYGYEMQVYTASILGRKQEGAFVSELKLHFTKELKHTVYIDHTIIKRGKAAQVVRTVRKNYKGGSQRRPPVVGEATRVFYLARCNRSDLRCPVNG